jgi:hypothetical protein
MTPILLLEQAAARLEELGELKRFMVGGVAFVKVKEPGKVLVVDANDLLQVGGAQRLPSIISLSQNTTQTLLPSLSPPSI